MAERARWYKDMCFYQIWPRSFKDGNGDGIGDLQGVLEKLDYIQSLHMDGIWFSPLYPSPNADYGYDVADYMDIAGEFGGMELFEQLVEELHRRGMKIIMDLVINHTSDQHPWFQASRRGLEPYKGYYYWRPAREGKNPLPNNWQSLFEGDAWSWDEERGAYYLHLFSPHQPDLNLRNPAVREEIKKIMRFWLDKGVDGFREDVITMISKPRGLPDGFPLPTARGIELYNHGPSVHAYLQEFRHDVLSRYDCVTIGEAPMTSPGQALEYIREDGGELDMLIQFDAMRGDSFFTSYSPHPFFLPKQKYLWARWQRRMDEGKAWNLLYLENHDHARVISRYGSEKYRSESGKALAASYLFQKGTPFVYQGQEIGMTNIRLDSIDCYEDVQTQRKYAGMKRLREDQRLKRVWRASRESSRTPMQWTDGPHGGFSEGEPWFYVNQNYRSVNVLQQEEDPNSLLNFYRRAMELRKSLPVVRFGSYRDLRPLSLRLHVYERCARGVRLLVICSYADKELSFRPPRGYDLRKGRLLLWSYPDAELRGNGCTLRPYECRVYLFTDKEEALPAPRAEETDLSEFYGGAETAAEESGEEMAEQEAETP